MLYHYLFRRPAKKEYASVILWYAQVSKELAVHFDNVVEKSLVLIRHHPKIFTKDALDYSSFSR